jgi:hypothetical protein
MSASRHARNKINKSLKWIYETSWRKWKVKRMREDMRGEEKDFKKKKFNFRPDFIETVIKMGDWSV